MPTQTKHAQGTFCWPELYVPDIDHAKKFYGALFGWTFNDTPMPGAGGDVYTIFQLGGRDVAAMVRLGPEMQKTGMPPNWGAYIAVDDADAAAKKAKELGGKVLMEPFDVMDTFGRMAVLQDPTGAVFSVWQAGTHTGVQVRDADGALTWNELMTNDLTKAKAFYSSLIGYRTESMPMPQGEYTLFKDPADGASRGGMMGITKEMGALPPHWMSYFQTSDIRKSLEHAKSLGGKVVMDVTPVPHVGEFAILADPQGAAFALLQPAS